MEISLEERIRACHYSLPDEDTANLATLTRQYAAEQVERIVIPPPTPQHQIDNLEPCDKHAMVCMNLQDEDYRKQIDAILAELRKEAK